MTAHSASGLIRKLASKAMPIVVVALIVPLLAACSSSPSASLPPKKKLSMTNVVLNSCYATNPGLPWIAIARGFFKQQGLKVDYENTCGSASADFSLLVAGKSQFVVVGTSSGLIARNQGASVRAVMTIDTGSPSTLAIDATKARSIGMPLSASTPSQAEKQLRALKGSHLKIGVTNLASDNYLILALLCKLNGIAIGPNGDIDVQTLGQAESLVAGWKAGKIDGYAITPPYTIQNGLATVPMHLIPPVTQLPWIYMQTTTAMIEKHPDTVEAMVTALVQAFGWAKANRAQGEKIAARNYAQDAGISSPAEQKALYAATSSDWVTPLMPKSAFDVEKMLLASAGQKIDVTYDQYVVPRFVNKAVKDVGLHL